VFKVPVLMEAIIQNINPQKTYNPNGPITIEIPGSKPWIVDNYGGEKFGESMSIIDATIHSVNVVYAQLTMEVGADNIEKLLIDMNIHDIGNNPAIGLGGLEKGITPLDISKIFSTLASGGIYHEPVCITKITDSKGEILYEYAPEKSSETKRIIDEPKAFLITQILQRVITEGTGKNANIGRPCAGKTGTTSDFRDAWFAGYTPELVTIVWMGHQDNNKPMEPINGRSITGGAFTAEIWREFMSETLKDKPVSQFKVPGDGLVEIQVCKDSGKLPTLWCPAESLESRLFVKGEIPSEYCNIHNKITIPDISGLHIDQGRQLLMDMFFQINELYEFNDEYEKDIILKTDPPAGTVIEVIDNANPTITIFISQGAEKIIMPDLTGQTKDSAESILNEIGLSITNIITDFSNLQPADLIFNQNPSPGSEVTLDTPITIYISKGVNPSQSVPEVIGLSKFDAINIMNNAGFNNIVISEEESKSIIGLVIKQSPSAGTIYAKDQPISITISKGIKVPDVTGMQKSSAVNQLTSLGFLVEISNDNNAQGKIISQSPQGSTFADFGSKVILTIEDIKETTTSSTQSETSSSSSSSSSTSSTTTTTTIQENQNQENI